MAVGTEAGIRAQRRTLSGPLIVPQGDVGLFAKDVIRRREGEVGHFAKDVIRRRKGEVGLFAKGVIRRRKGEVGLFAKDVIRRREGEVGLFAKDVIRHSKEKEFKVTGLAKLTEVRLAGPVKSGSMRYCPSLSPLSVKRISSQSLGAAVYVISTTMTT